MVDSTSNSDKAYINYNYVINQHPVQKDRIIKMEVGDNNNRDNSTGKNVYSSEYEMMISGNSNKQNLALIPISKYGKGIVQNVVPHSSANTVASQFNNSSDADACCSVSTNRSHYESHAETKTNVFNMNFSYKNESMAAVVDGNRNNQKFKRSVEKSCKTEVTFSAKLQKKCIMTNYITKEDEENDNVRNVILPVSARNSRCSRIPQKIMFTFWMVIFFIAILVLLSVYFNDKDRNEEEVLEEKYETSYETNTTLKPSDASRNNAKASATKPKSGKLYNYV